MEKEGLLMEIGKLRGNGKLIIVEGQEDRAALEAIGLTNIFQLNKKPLFHVIEEISSKGKDAVILTDLDKHGKKLYGKLYDGLCQHGVRIDNTFRNFLYKRTKLRQIQGMANYLQNFG